MIKNKGFITLPILLAITGIIISAFSVFISFQGNSKKETPSQLGAQILTVPQGGTGSGQYASSTWLFANGTDKLVSSSSPTVGWISATTTGTASIVQNLTVLGTCTGCGAGSTVTLQNAYDSTSGNAAELRLANSKDFIISLQDTATDPNFTVNFETGAGGLFLIQRASSTVAMFTRDGALGLGTTSPGGGLGVAATTTVLNGNANIAATSSASSFIATSTLSIGTSTIAGIYQFAVQGNSLFTGGLSIGISATTVPGALFTGGLSSLSSLYLQGTATSSYEGGIVVKSIGGLTSLSGLTITGDFLLNGKIADSNSATSTFVGGAFASSSLEITGRVVATPRGGCQSSGLLNFSGATGGCLSITGDTTISAENVLPNQHYTFWIYHDHTSGNSDLAWASSTNNVVFYFVNGIATTTSTGQGDLDICSLASAATSSAQLLPIAVQCAPNFMSAGP